MKTFLPQFITNRQAPANTRFERSICFLRRADDKKPSDKL